MNEKEYVESFLEHYGMGSAPDENYLQHWKYIKRERKNGKWVYTYPNDKLGVKNFISTKITGKAYKQHAQEATTKKIAVDNSANSTRFSRTRAEIESKGPSWDDPKVIALKKKEEALSKQSKALKNESAEAKANYQNKSVKGAIESEVEAVVSNAKDFAKKAKDKLGVDERQKYQEAKTKYETAKEKKATAEDNLKKFYKVHGDDHYKEYPYKQSNELHWDNAYWRERVETRGREYMSAKNEYMKTPLGTALRAKEAISDAASEVSYFLENGLFRKKKKNSSK